ncbi:hypothetical protein BDW59DRAFT_164591 [Aspergillus cavernicola]|uniref:Uncharacterized protein n=1 Tax=Aspergillus cavernicola TaxID=176166 RepID=A0ABR4HYH9_9EURO
MSVGGRSQDCGRTAGWADRQILQEGPYDCSPASTFLTSSRDQPEQLGKAWNSSWWGFWAQQMKSIFEQDKHAHDPDEELESLKSTFLEEVIPRWLDPLESNGRSVDPYLNYYYSRKGIQE